MEVVFSLRELMKRYREKKKILHTIFIDMEKAYNSLHRVDEDGEVSYTLQNLLDQQKQQR